MPADPLTKKRKSGNPQNICEEYRRLLKRPNLTDREIETMRKNMILLAQTICEHIWGKKSF